MAKPVDPGRAMTLADVMLLVLGLAVGLAPARALRDSLNQMPGVSLGRPEVQWLYEGAWVLAGLGLSVVVAELRRPAISWRRRLRRPGFVACLAATVAVGFAAGPPFVALLTKPSWGPTALLFALLYSSPNLIAPAVLVAWLLAGIGGGRPCPDWRDRLGCLVGLCWVAASVALAFLR